MPVKTPISVEEIKDKLRFLYEVIPLSIPEELKPRFDVYTKFGFCEATANYLLAPNPPDSTRFSETDYGEDNPYPQTSTTGLRYIKFPSTFAEGGVKQWIPLEIDLDFQQEISAFRLDECLMVLTVVVLTQVQMDEFDVSLHLLNFPDCTPFYDMQPIDLKTVSSYETREAMEQWPRVILSTYEHQIGVLIRGEVTDLYIYDWPSGTQRMHLVGKDYDSFSFVKANTIIISNDMYLDIWTTDTIPKKRRPTKLCSLALPDKSAGCSVQFVSSMKRCMKACCHDGDDIITIRLIGSSIDYCVIIPAFLYSIAAKFRSKRPSPCPIFPWTEWGPQNFMLRSFSPHSTSSLSENRYAVLDQLNKENLAMFYFSCWGKHNVITSTYSLINLTIDADHVLLVPRKVIGVKWIGRFSTLDVCYKPINPPESDDLEGGTDSDDSES